jgi:hypothetical protein
MRYHKAIAVTKPEADFIMETGAAARSEIVVVSRGDQFYDVRAMSHAEVEAFIADLARAEHADAALACSFPC